MHNHLVSQLTYLFVVYFCNQKYLDLKSLSKIFRKTILSRPMKEWLVLKMQLVIPFEGRSCLGL